MIAIDLDGTLLSPSGQVTPRAKAAIHKALNAGLLVCFATGRNWTESRAVLEIFDPAVNKWEGVLHVARRHSIRPDEIVAIGDDLNDIPMLRSAGLGVAMGNARPEVQAAAKRVIGANHE